MIETIIISASVTSVVTVCVSWAFKRAVERFLAMHEMLIKETARERSELLERIQRPEAPPQSQRSPLPDAWNGWEQETPDLSHLVGTIQWDDKYLNEDAEGGDAYATG